MTSSPMPTITSLSRNKKSDNFQLYLRGFFILACVGLLAFFVLSVGSPNDEPVPESAKVVTTKTAGAISSGHLMEGSLNGVDYSHCGAHSHVGVRDVILLHGAKFTKNNWKESKILEKLCANGKVSVTALDLSVSSDGKTLQSLLKGLALGEGLLSPEGNYAVVTPSASGKAMVDWINKGDLEELVATVGLWIPIASPAISNANVDRLHALQKQSWPILALYGDEDAMGRRVSERLQKEAGAKIKEFPGPHPFYFSIPSEFTKYLLEELQVV